MPVVIPRGPTPDADPKLGQVVRGLERYLDDHPGATAEAYRHMPFIVNVRVTDPAFAGVGLLARIRAVLAYLSPELTDADADTPFVVPVAPGEKPTRSSRKFDRPPVYDDPPPRPARAATNGRPAPPAAAAT